MMIPNFLFILLQNLVFDFSFFNIPQIFPDQILRIGRIFLNAFPFAGQGCMVGTQLNQNPLHTPLLAGMADQIPEPRVGEKIKRSQG